MNSYNSEQNRMVLVFRWFLPTAVEVALYIGFILTTIALTNTSFIQDYFLVPDDFSLRTAVLGSFENMLTELVGARAAATLVTAIFWALVGVLIYLLLWLMGNFSTELTNDLAVTKYIHPRGSDTYSPLKALMFRIIYHSLLIILLLFYLSFLVQTLLPFLSSRYEGVTKFWGQTDAMLGLFWAGLCQFVAMHIMIIIIRLLLFRKRVFG